MLGDVPGITTYYGMQEEGEGSSRYKALLSTDWTVHLVDCLDSIDVTRSPGTFNIPLLHMSIS